MSVGLLLCHSNGARAQNSIHGLYTETNGDWAAHSRTDWDSLEWAPYSGGPGIICSTCGRPFLSALQAPAGGPTTGGPNPRPYLSGFRILFPLGLCTAKPTHINYKLSFRIHRGRTQSSNIGRSSWSQTAVMEPAAGFVLSTA